MNLEQLVFVGFNGSASALDRDTGEIIWKNDEMHNGHVTFLLDGDRLIVSTNGFIYCLNPLTGDIIWNNDMKGFGYGIASLTSVRGSSSQFVLHQAAKDAETAHNASMDSTPINPSQF
jgi:outer membrane protein assembly factor BamB